MACPCKNVIWVECPGSFYKVVKRIAIKQSTSAHCDQAFISIGKEDKAIDACNAGLIIFREVLACRIWCDG